MMTGSSTAKGKVSQVSNAAGSGEAIGGGPSVGAGPTENSTEPKFSDVLGKVQATMGAKKEKPREIKKTLGKDDFLRIMITQMQNQDPSSPFKPEQMAAEMAQFASVEQLNNVNMNLAKMANQNQPLERMAISNLIGKTVTVDKDRFVHAEGQNDPLSVELPKDAKEMQVAIVSQEGEVVFEKELGPQQKGEVSFTWDGMKKNSLPAKAGNYMIRVAAKDDRESPIQFSGASKARVSGVSFEGNDTVLIIGTGLAQQKVPFKAVVRIEDEAEQPQNSMNNQMGGQLGGSAAPAPRMQPAPQQAAPLQSQMSPAKMAAVNPAAGFSPINFASGAAGAEGAKGAGVQAPSAPVKAEGFPNGLNSKGGEIN